jgi:hypothetical protein
MRFGKSAYPRLSLQSRLSLIHQTTPFSLFVTRSAIAKGA